MLKRLFDFIKDFDERTPLVNDEVMGTTEAPSTTYPPPVVGYISGHNQGTMVYLAAAKPLTSMGFSMLVLFLQKQFSLYFPNLSRNPGINRGSLKRTCKWSDFLSIHIVKISRPEANRNLEISL